MTPRKPRSNPQLRILSAMVLATMALALTWFGGVWFRLFATATAMLMFYEWTTMTGARRHAAHFAILWVAMSAVAIPIVAGQPPSVVFGVVAAGALAASVSGLVFGQGWSGAVGLAYSGVSGAALSFLRGDDGGGLILILFLFSVVWATDIFAYYVGRAVGGAKLAPSISPGKTWSGAIGGAGFAVVAGLAFSVAAGGLMLAAAAAALILSVLSQIGDLAESAAKRRYGVKDSGFLIPGHGGVMDRVDGLVAAAIALYAIGWALSVSGIAAQGLFPS